MFPWGNFLSLLQRGKTAQLWSNEKQNPRCCSCCRWSRTKRRVDKTVKWKAWIMQHKVVRGGSSGEQVQQRTSSIVVPGPKQKKQQKTWNGHKESSCDAALPANMDRKPSVTLCPATHAASLFSAPSAVSERDGGKVPADPITRPTSQACKSTNAHRRRCRVWGWQFALCPLFFRIRTRWASSNTLAGCLRWRGRGSRRREWAGTLEWMIKNQYRWGERERQAQTEGDVF